jgi:hypothetical protein
MVSSGVAEGSSDAGGVTSGEEEGAGGSGVSVELEPSSRVILTLYVVFVVPFSAVTMILTETVSPELTVTEDGICTDAL